MIAAWMLYIVAVSGLIAIAALCLDRVAAWRGRPRRGVWVVALMLTIAWTVASSARRPTPTHTQSRPALGFTIVIGPEPTSPLYHADASSRITLDSALAIGWLMASTACAWYLAAGAIALRRRRRTWRRARIDDADVHISTRDGPALIGLRRMDVVIPEWILSLEAPLRAMILCHEREHREARDPYLLVAAAIAVTLMPWNIALWLMNRRLRLAIELDCDARVLRTHPVPDLYARLLLVVAQRRSMPLVPMFMPRFSLSASDLTRRISAMQPTLPARRRAIYTAAVLAVAALLVACTLRTPPATAASSPANDRSALDAFMTAQGFSNWTYVHAAVGNRPPRYPDALRGAQGTVLAQFVVDTMGRVDPQNLITILSSTDERFSASVREALPSMRFVAAVVDGRKVKQLTQVPFEFRPATDSGASPTPEIGHRTTRCDRGDCPVLRLQQVVITVAP